MLLTILFGAFAAAAADVCTMADSDRYDCWDGEFALNDESCAQRGCCWSVHETRA